MASAEECEARGTEHFKKKEYELAVQAFAQAISQKPKEPAYWLGRSAAYRQLQQWENAEQDAALALELDLTIPQAWHARALCLQHLGRLQEAASICEGGLGLCANDPALQQLSAELRDRGVMPAPTAGAAPSAGGRPVGQREPSSSSSSSGVHGKSAAVEVSAEDAPCLQLCDLAEAGDAAGCRGLLEGGGVRDVSWRRPGDGNTALHLAAEEAHLQVVQVLLAAGADPEVTNDFFLTPYALCEPGSDIERMLRAVTKPLGDERRAALRPNI